MLPGAWLLSAGAAEAQTTVKLVSTTGQTDGTPVEFFRFINDRAQRFTTGSSAGGYTLKRVDLLMSHRISNPTAPAYTVKIHNVTSSGPGSTVLGTLTNPASVVDGTNSYTTSGIDLEPNTQYYVVIDVTGTGGNHHQITNDVTAEDDEDSGAYAGWSIGDGSRHRGFESTGAWTADPRTWKMDIRGVVKPLPPAPSGLLSNTGQGTVGGNGFGSDTAQAFTTGSDPAKLTGVDLIMRKVSGSTPAYTVTIRQDSSGSPGSVLGTLTNPASLPASSESRRYAAPSGGIDLEANKTYWVMIDVTSGASNQTSAATTTVGAEDAGAPPGWSIANTRLSRGWSGTTWMSQVLVLKIAIQGYIKSSRPTLAPAPPTLSGTDGTELTITWKAPAAVLAPPTDYDVRYRRKGDTAWTDHPHDGTALTTTITGLLQGASWEAQVAASNRVGPGQWSDSGFGHTGPARLVRAETARAGGGIVFYYTKDLSTSVTGSRFTILVNGVHRNALGGTSRNGNQMGLSLASAVQAGETVTASYAQTTISFFTDEDGLKPANFTNVSVTNLVAATAPAAPAAPSVSAVTSSRNLTVSWTAPTSSSTITDYDLRYYAGSSDPDDEEDWVLEHESSGLTDPGTSTSATLSGLAASTAYRVQVRAQNGTGKGPWSPSGTGTTNSSSATNTAPFPAELAEQDGVKRCGAKSQSDTSPYTTISFASGNFGVAVDPITDTSQCGNVLNRRAPMFVDAESNTMTFTAQANDLPDNVTLGSNSPLVRLDSDRIFFQAAAAFRTTDVRFDVTATDEHGASGTTHVIVRLVPFSNTNGAPVLANPGPRRYALNAAIQPLVLPAATGGDVSGSHLGFTVTAPYYYAVTGLPPGLTFDAATRTISGTPTEAGTYRVTYTADDADGTASAARNPNTVDGSDTTGVEFIIQVGNQPGIERVRIVSKPMFDADGDGTADTYIKDAPIHIDVEFNEPVKVTGDKNLRLRLDLGTDDANQGNSRESPTLDSVRHNGQTLRFTYTVERSNTCTATTQHGDCDRDGIWVQSNAQDRVVFSPGGATIVHAVTGEEADYTYAHLPTPGPNAGDPLHKVDGSKGVGDVGPLRQVPTVNGDTLTVEFFTSGAGRSMTEPTSAELDALRYDFFVRGAGGIGADARDHSQSPTAITYFSSDVLGTGLTLTLGTPARAGDTVTLTYTGTTLKANDGKRAPMFRGRAVTNNTPGTAGPMPLHASVAGNKLNMVFGADLDTSSLPSGSAFLVEAVDLDGDTREIAGTGAVTIADDRVVTVTLASGMRADEYASVSYEKPDTNPLRGSASGPEVQSFDRFRIASAEDGVAPTLRGSSVVETGSAQSKMVLHFDEALNMYSVPAAGDFAVSVSGAAATVSAVAVEDRSVVLTLARAAASGTVFQVTYTPGTNRIRDWAGNAAAGFRQTLSAAAAGKPALQSARAEGAKVVLTYDKPLDPADTPAADAFVLHLELLKTGGLNQQIGGTTASTSPALIHNDITGITVSGRTAVLHLRDPVMPCQQAFEVTYVKPAASPIQGLDGTDADAFASQEVTNVRAYRCNNSDWMKGARVGSVILTAKRPFATDVEPQASWFTVTASGGPVTVTGAAYSEDDENELKLSLSRDLVPGEEVTVSYRRPEGERGLWDTDGNQLGDIEDQAVSNPAPGAPPAPDAPAVTMASATSVSVSWTAPDTTNLEAVTGYDVQYRRQGDTDWTDHEHEGTATSTTIGGLAAGARWQARVRAVNPDGFGDWSEPGTGHTGPARLTGVAMPAHGQGLVLTFTKDIDVSGVHTAYTVMVGGNRRATAHASWDGATVSLVLAAPVRSGETVTVAYAQPTGRIMLHDVDGLAVAGFGPQAVANTVVRPANAAATGAPAISGTTRVGETLTASTAGIADANGLTGAAYAWQWVAGGADIAGATGRSYTLAEAEARKRVAVRVSFTDDDGYRETLTSAATEAVEPLLPPLTASFHGMPSEHDGHRLFSFELRFGDNFPGRLDYKVLRDEAFVVTNGKVRAAKRMTPGQNQRWTISVRPSSHEAVTVSLPAGSVTTESGRTLAETVTATVAGPALLAVADARASEGADAAVAFPVTLSRAASGEVTVQYLTRDGTAKAGEDYTHTRGTLTFAVGETEKTVSVPILDDALDEGEETFTLKLRNAKGAYIVDGEATGTIENSDPLQKMWLSRFGRTVADHVTSAVSDRLANPLTGAQVTVGGQSIDLAATGDEALLGQTLTSIAQVMGAPAGPASGGDPGSGPLGSEPLGAGPGHAGAEPWPGTALGAAEAPMLAGAPARSILGRELLRGSAFHLAMDGDGAVPGLAAWGRVTAGGFDGEAPSDSGSVRIDGEVMTGILGADAGWDRVLAGLAVSVSEGEGTFDQPGVDSGSIESTMTTVSPYARMHLGERISAWGLAGVGTGDMTIVQAANTATGQPERTTRADLALRLAALGGRGALLEASESGGFDLALKADAFYAETTAEAVSGEGDTTAAASRVRLALEGSRAFTMGGGVLTPGLELGLRHDGGDAETGTGVELGGRVSWSDATSGLSVEASVRALVAHEDAGYEEWGASGAIRLDPGPAGRGLALRLAPTYGAPASGVERLWSARDARGLAPTGGVFEPESRLEGELGYGVALPGGFTGTPNVGFAVSGGARDVRVGWRLAPAGAAGFELNLDATRREFVNADGAGAAPVEHGVLLRGALRW